MRPAHRSKALWLGLLLIVFLAAAWILSFGQSQGLAINSRSHTLTIAQAHGFLAAEYWDGIIISPSGKANRIHYPSPGVKWFQKPLPDTSDLDPRLPVQIQRRHHTTGIAISHWLILLFLIPWTVHLVRRTRRSRSLTNTDTPRP